MALPDLTGQNIQDTYQRVLQTNGVNILDGTGSLFIPPTASYAEYAVSASHEIIKEVSSSYADYAKESGLATSSISASYALTSSYALNSPDVFPYTGSAIISGSLEVAGDISSSTYYGDGSNLTGISTTPFPFEGDAVITGSLTVSASFVDFSDATVVNIPNLESLSLINPIVEYLDITASISSGTTLTLPNNLSYISSSTYEYIEIFMNGLRIRYNIDFVPMSNTTIQTQVAFPSGSELTFKSLKR